MALTVRDIMDAGGRIAFGTDGISFSDRDDFFTELRLACYLQRLPREFGQGRLDSERVLRAAAGNGARALGLPGRLGSLEPGRYADLLVVRKDRIFFPPGRYDGEPFLDVVLDRAESGDIDTVMAAGRVLMEGGRVTVHVAGAVQHPGVYRLRRGERVDDAVRRAGGPSRRADLSAVNLAAVVEDGRQVLVPTRAPAVSAPGTTSASATPAKVNLNTATPEQLDTLAGVGPATAAKILAFREQHGGFGSVEELGDVPGIGEVRLDALRDLVTV